MPLGLSALPPPHSPLSPLHPFYFSLCIPAIWLSFKNKYINSDLKSLYIIVIYWKKKKRKNPWSDEIVIWVTQAEVPVTSLRDSICICQGIWIIDSKFWFSFNCRSMALGCVRAILFPNLNTLWSNCLFCPICVLSTSLNSEFKVIVWVSWWAWHISHYTAWQGPALGKVLNLAWWYFMLPL